MSYFDKLNRTKAQKVTNVLLEAPFFYREDDADLFLFLRRHKAAFQRFFEECFDWELLVDERCARLYKSTWYNKALRPSQHDVFDLTRRDQCIAFLLVLEFYEHQLQVQNLSIDDAEPPCFFYGELLEFCCQRFTEELGSENDEAPDEASVRRTLRSLMDTLLRYRFVREVKPEGDDHIEDRENLLYQCLPGLYCYDLRRLGAAPLARFLGVETESPAEVSP